MNVCVCTCVGACAPCSSWDQRITCDIDFSSHHLSSRNQTQEVGLVSSGLIDWVILCASLWAFHIDTLLPMWRKMGCLDFQYCLPVHSRVIYMEWFISAWEVEFVNVQSQSWALRLPRKTYWMFLAPLPQTKAHLEADFCFLLKSQGYSFSKTAVLWMSGDIPLTFLKQCSFDGRILTIITTSMMKVFL